MDLISVALGLPVSKSLANEGNEWPIPPNSSPPLPLVLRPCCICMTTAYWMLNSFQVNESHLSAFINTNRLRFATAATKAALQDNRGRWERGKQRGGRGKGCETCEQKFYILSGFAPKALRTCPKRKDSGTKEQKDGRTRGKVADWRTGGQDDNH